MNCKSTCQNWIYFLALILCVIGASFQLRGTYAPTYVSIENYETELRIDELLLLMQKRLMIMHEVARTKWNQNLPLEDKGREQQILADLTAKASEDGLDEKIVSRFFQAQMDAAKEVQKNDFLFWKEAGITKFEKVFSLKDELRSVIDQINNEMLILLSKIYTKPIELKTYIPVCPPSTRPSETIQKDIWLLAISPLQN